MARDGIIAQFLSTASAASDAIADFAADLRGDSRADRPAAPVLGREPPFDRIDAAAIAAVTDLYREMLPPGGAILDVISGWVPHLPPEAPYRRVVGIGLDRGALAENPFLDEWRVQDLNANPILPFGIGEFDGATIFAAVQ